VVAEHQGRQPLGQQQHQGVQGEAHRPTAKAQVELQLQLLPVEACVEVEALAAADSASTLVQHLTVPQRPT